MKRFDGKNAWWLILIFVIYNICPVVIFLIDNEIISNVWWIMLWIFYYGFNLFWLPIFIRNYIELYEDYFVFYYGFSKEIIYLKDIRTMKKSRNPIASSANSLDRINIVTKDKDFYISLKDNDTFIKDINDRQTI